MTAPMFQIGRGLTMAGLLRAVADHVEREPVETFADDVFREAAEHLCLLLEIRFREADGEDIGPPVGPEWHPPIR